MEKLTKINKSMFNKDAMKEAAKKGLQIAKKGMLVGFVAGSLALAGCKHDIDEDEVEKKFCGVENCINYEELIDEEHKHTCKEEGCLDKSYNGDDHDHDYCNEQECATKKVTDHTTTEHDYCKEETCPGTQDKKHGHCDNTGCDFSGKIYDDYEKEHGPNHTINGQPDHCIPCDDIQDENHGHCEQPGCVDVNKAFDNYNEEHPQHTCDESEKCKYPHNFGNGSHTHDFCGNTDCLNTTDKTTNPDHVHNYGVHPEYAKWVEWQDFGNGFKVPYVKLTDTEEENGYLDLNNNHIDAEGESLNDFQNEYQKFIQDLTFSEAFTNKFSELPFSVSENSTDKYNVDIEFKTFTTYNDSENFKINANENFDYLIKNINDVCVPVFEEMTKYVGISLDDENNTNPTKRELDKMRFLAYNTAMGLEAYKAGCSYYFDSIGKDYYEKQKNDPYSGLVSGWDYCHSCDGFGDKNTNKFDLYITDGNGEEVLNPETIFFKSCTSTPILPAAHFNTKSICFATSVSLVMNSLDAVHDYMSSKLDHTTGSCYAENSVIDTINDVEVENMAYIQNNNKGIELC